MLAFITISGTEFLTALQFPVIRERRVTMVSFVLYIYIKVPFNHTWVYINEALKNGLEKNALEKSFSKLWEIVKDREAWHTVVHGVAESDMT